MNPFFPLKILSIHQGIQSNQATFKKAVLLLKGIPDEENVDRYVLCLPQIHCAIRHTGILSTPTTNYRYRLVVPKKMSLRDHKKMAFEAYQDGILTYRAPLEDLPFALALAVEVEILHMLSRKNGPVVTQL